MTLYNQARLHPGLVQRIPALLEVTGSGRRAGQPIKGLPVLKGLHYAYWRAAQRVQGEHSAVQTTAVANNVSGPAADIGQSLPRSWGSSSGRSRTVGVTANAAIQ